MENSTKPTYERLMNKLYKGGMQRHFPRNEAQIYMGKFTLDVASYCFNSFDTTELTNEEQSCAERLVAKNKEFMNL